MVTRFDGTVRAINSNKHGITLTRVGVFFLQKVTENNNGNLRRTTRGNMIFRDTGKLSKCQVDRCTVERGRG